VSIEIQSSERETSPAQVLVAANLGKPSPLCYGLINEVKIESNTNLQQHVWTIKSHLQTQYKAVHILQCHKMDRMSFTLRFKVVI